MTTLFSSQGLCATGHSVTEGTDTKNQTLHTARSQRLRVIPATSLLRSLLNWLAKRGQRKLDRDAYRHMLTLSDELLADIGVTRDQVRWAEKLPLDQNAALVLREVAQGGPHTSAAEWECTHRHRT